MQGVVPIDGELEEAFVLFRGSSRCGLESFFFNNIVAFLLSDFCDQLRKLKIFTIAWFDFLLLHSDNVLGYLPNAERND